jgi:hypothetical protein
MISMLTGVFSQNTLDAVLKEEANLANEKIGRNSEK